MFLLIRHDIGSAPTSDGPGDPPHACAKCRELDTTTPRHGRDSRRAEQNSVGGAHTMRPGFASRPARAGSPRRHRVTPPWLRPPDEETKGAATPGSPDGTPFRARATIGGAGTSRRPRRTHGHSARHGERRPCETQRLLTPAGRGRSPNPGPGGGASVATLEMPTWLCPPADRRRWGASAETVDGTLTHTVRSADGACGRRR